MYIKREKYLQKLRPFYEVDLIKVLTGVRRCGKSILLTQIEEEFLAKGVDESHIIKVNFEDIQYEKIRTYEKLNKYVISKITDEAKYYIFQQNWQQYGAEKKNQLMQRHW